MKTYLEFFTTLNEDLPTNSAGGGQIDGIGVGVNPEPGVNKKNRFLIKRRGKDAAARTARKRRNN